MDRECEKEWIDRILGGESQLYERFVTHYGSLVFTVCVNVLRNDSDARSVSQDAFVAAFFSLSSFHGECFKSWLCRIAVNKAIDFKRKQARVRRYEQQDDDVLNLIADRLDVAYAVESGEHSRRVREMVNALPEKYAGVVRAHYFEEQTVPAIAAATGLPPKTIETRLYRARKMMRERWTE